MTATAPPARGWTLHELVRGVIIVEEGSDIGAIAANPIVDRFTSKRPPGFALLLSPPPPPTGSRALCDSAHAHLRRCDRCSLRIWRWDVVVTPLRRLVALSGLWLAGCRLPAKLERSRTRLEERA